MVFPQPNNGNVCRETWDLLAMETWIRKKFLLEVNLILSTPSLPRNLAASLQLNNGNVCKEWDHKHKWEINKIRRKFLSTANLILSIPSSLRNLMVFPQPNNGNVCRETWDLLAMKTWIKKKFLLEVNLILSTPSLPRNLAASLQLNNGNVCKEWDHKDKWKINKI